MKDILQALHLRAGNAPLDASAHHGVDLDAVAPAKPEPRSEAAAADGGWEIPVLTTNALTEEGVPDLLEAIERHRAWLDGSGELSVRRRKRAGVRVRDVVDRELRRAAWSSEATDGRLDTGLDQIERGEGTPYSVAREILAVILR